MSGCRIVLNVWRGNWEVDELGIRKPHGAGHRIYTSADVPEMNLGGRKPTVVIHVMATCSLQHK